MGLLRIALLTVGSVWIAGCANWSDRMGSQATMNARPVNSSGYNNMMQAPPPPPPMQPMAPPPPAESFTQAPAMQAPQTLTTKASYRPTKLYNMEPASERARSTSSKPVICDPLPTQDEVLKEVPAPAQPSAVEAATAESASEPDTAMLATPVRKRSNSQ